MAEKVLITSQSSAYGGVERRLIQEAKVLLDLGYEVWLAPSSFEGSDIWISEMRRLGVQLWNWHPYKFIERQQGYPPFTWLGLRGRKRLSMEGFKFAHVALPWTRVGLSRVHDLTCAGVPVVLGMHCNYPKEQWSERLDPYIARALTGVVSAYAVSDVVRQSFLNNYARFDPPFQIDVIYNGINTQRFKPCAQARSMARKNWGLRPKDQVFVFCGRLDPFKRPMLALDAFALLSDYHPAARLVFLGDGDLRGALEARVAELNLKHHVYFAGFVKNVHDVLPGADVYLSPTTEGEGFGLGPAEALACGIPALITKTKAITEIYSRHELVTLIASSEPSIWAAEMLDALRGITGTQSASRRSTRASIVEHFDEEVMMKNLLAHYKQLEAFNRKSRATSNSAPPPTGTHLHGY